jgi:hypothetical protein
MCDSSDYPYYNDPESCTNPKEDNNDRCIISDFGGKGHPYSFCIKNMNQMVAPKVEPEETGLRKTSKYVAGILNYGEGLLCSPEKSVRKRCENILGNRYVLKTGQKCQKVDATDGSITDELKDLHKYINNESDGDNVLTDGNTDGGGLCNGIIPSTLGSVGKINAFGILGAFIGPTTPLCMEAKVKCHIVDKNNDKEFTGFSPPVYLNICDLYNHVKNNDLVNNTRPAGLNSLEVDGKRIQELCGGFLQKAGILGGFTNMNLNPKSSPELGGCQSTKWGCCPGENQLFGKAKRDKKGSNCNNTNDNYGKMNDLFFNTYSKNKNQNYNSFENDNMINLYIISISLLFMFIIFKLITKKK